MSNQSGGQNYSIDHTGFVPYTGATGDVNLGAWGLTAQEITATGVTRLKTTYIGLASGATTIPLIFYQGVNGTAGLTAYIQADYDQLYLVNPEGGIMLAHAFDEAHALQIQESGGSFESCAWWFDGASAGGTGVNMSAPAGAGSINLRLGDSAGAFALNIRDSDNAIVANLNSDGLLNIASAFNCVGDITTGDGTQGNMYHCTSTDGFLGQRDVEVIFFGAPVLFDIYWSVEIFNNPNFAIPILRPHGGAFGADIGGVANLLYILGDAGLGSAFVLQNGDGYNGRLDYSIGNSFSYVQQGAVSGGTFWNDDFTISADYILNTEGGRKKPPTVVTTATYDILVTDYEVHFDGSVAQAGDFPDPVDGQSYRLKNCGSSGNDVTINLFGGAFYATLYDGESILRTYNTDLGGWY